MASSSQRTRHRSCADNECPPGGTAQATEAQSSESPATAGSVIGFASDRDGDWDIYVMDPNGNNLTQLTDSPGIDWNPDGSPDGKRIVFESQRDGNSEIYIMNADGSNPINLTRNPGYDSSPAWSPDGQHIAFTSSREGNSEIYVVNAEGGEPINLTGHAAGDANPDWAPDGHHLVFESDRDGALHLYVLRFDNGEVNRLSADWDPTSRRSGRRTEADSPSPPIETAADRSMCLALPAVREAPSPAIGRATARRLGRRMESRSSLPHTARDRVKCM